MAKELIQVFTGEGFGRATVVAGLAARALEQGRRRLTARQGTGC